MNKPKILFVHDSKYEVMDGLWAALNLLEEDFEIYRMNLAVTDKPQPSPMSNDGYDFMLGWGGFNSSVDKFFQETIPNADEPKGLCIGGNAFPPSGADNYDVLFYETKWYRPQISFHKNIVHAFGINSDIYNKIDIPTPIVWDYIGVGSLSDWKHWDKMIEKKGNRLVIGEYQVDNQAESSRIANHLLSNVVMVSNMVSPYDLANFYHWSRTCYIPADINGGGERAVLEARACGLDVEIDEFANPKLKELLSCEIYDEKYYAKKLKEGILSTI